MKKLLLIFIPILLLSVVSASDYYIEFNQVKDDLVIEERIDDLKISKYVSDEVLEKSQEGYYFVQKIVFEDSYDNVRIRLNLDIGFILDRDTIFPDNYEIESDGQTISLVWEIENVKKDSVFAVFVSIVDITSQYEILIIILIIIVLGGGYFYLKRKQPKTKKKSKTSSKEDKQKIIESHLLESEMKIISELKKAKRRELWQKELEKKTEFSKAKLSRVIHNLEERNLITKTPFGNTNKIKLR
jgi:uncharacterized membrane protein